MATAHDAIDQAIEEAGRLRSTLKKSKTLQVQSREEKDLAKSTSLAWFNRHFLDVAAVLNDEECKSVNALHHQIIAYTDRSTSRSKYDNALKSVKKELSSLRTRAISAGAKAVGATTSDKPPDFSTLIGDAQMQRILGSRWTECSISVQNSCPLAATVMMGGLLETLLLARFNKEPDMSKVFKASSAPIDKKTGKTQQLKEWTLRSYLDVACELGWVTKSAKDVGEVLRDFRNYIHPYKQASHGVELNDDDARLFWEISKELARQLL